MNLTIQLSPLGQRAPDGVRSAIPAICAPQQLPGAAGRPLPVAPCPPWPLPHIHQRQRPGAAAVVVGAGGAWRWVAPGF